MKQQHPSGFFRVRPYAQSVLKHAFLLVFLLIGSAAFAHAETVTLPIRMDYAMLRALVIAKAFTGPNETAAVVSKTDPCRKVLVSEPKFRMEKNLLRSEAKLHVDAGAFLAGACRLSMKWDGYIVLYQRPRINGSWVLSFESVDSALLNEHHDATKLPDLIWQIIAEEVYDFFDRIQINLAPPVKDVKSILLSLFPEDNRQGAAHLIESMKPGPIRMLAEEIVVDILADTGEPAAQQKPESPERALSPEETAAFIQTWESYDTFLVTILQTLVNEPLTQEERSIIFAAIIDTRYRFVDGLTKPQSHSGMDFVREQFISTWNRLSPVFRAHLGKDPSQALLAYLAFFSASDALSALDKLGPVLGIEISRDGLIRLARLVTQKEQVLLQSSDAVDVGLRKVMGFGKPIESVGPVYDLEEIPLPEQDNGNSSSSPLSRWFKFLGISICEAANGISPAELEQIRQWIATPGNIENFVQQILVLLADVTEADMKKNPVPETYRDLYRNIITATAWQESCFRQYLQTKGKITYLISYNNTSVGMMQVNEKVWKNIYDLKALRWDIRYNAQAGSEIVNQYFTRFVLPKAGKNTDGDTLAGAMYAMYNSGPGDLNNYFKRKAAGKPNMTDKLFAQKFSWVKQNQMNNISACLGG